MELAQLHLQRDEINKAVELIKSGTARGHAGCIHLQGLAVEMGHLPVRFQNF